MGGSTLMFPEIWVDFLNIILPGYFLCRAVNKLCDATNYCNRLHIKALKQQHWTSERNVWNLRGSLEHSQLWSSGAITRTSPARPVPLPSVGVTIPMQRPSSSLGPSILLVGSPAPPAGRGRLSLWEQRAGHTKTSRGSGPTKLVTARVSPVELPQALDASRGTPLLWGGSGKRCSRLKEQFSWGFLREWWPAGIRGRGRISVASSHSLL